MSSHKQPWLGSPQQECIFILGPAIIPVVFIFLFQDYFASQKVNTWWWLVLVLCIDVGHVYSTLFRLYWDRNTFRQYKSLLIIIPVVAFAAGLGLHFFSAHLFWRVLAYIAVYHFVRQQYGFMRLYSRKEKAGNWARWLDTFAIYSATLYPLLYWHLHATDSLAWFVKGDFIAFNLEGYETFFRIAYFAIMTAYVFKEVYYAMRSRVFNIPKNLMIVGTYISWYVGIVAFQGDLIFTLLNVVAHGITYMALIWIHGEKKTQSGFSFNGKGLAIFIITILTFAYFEELFWDIFVWNDHPEVFPALNTFLSPGQPVVMSIIVSLLVLPQVTHYVLDGFIWRFSRDVQARME
jgi:hypothetical protein